MIIAERKKLKLVIENPYSTQHYLTQYWCVKPAIIDKDRRENGDAYRKPTQYYFINVEPKNNLVFDGITLMKSKSIELQGKGAERSMISKEYARRFIKTYLIDGEGSGDES